MAGWGISGAAGVVFLLLVEANRQGREQGIQGPDLMTLSGPCGAGHGGRCSPAAGR